MSSAPFSPADVLTHIDLPGVKLYKRGKVREVFDLGPNLLIVATDRISAFDVIMADGIPGKGQVLTALSQHWFDSLKDIVPNHSLGTEVDRFPIELQPHRAVLAGRSMLCVKTEAQPVECVVRGYLVGSGWKEYQKTGAVCGLPLPSGLDQASRLPQPIFTPSTKAETGHDQNISREQMATLVGKELTDKLEAVSLELYRRASAYALERGIIVADTKFEFGVKDGKVMLIDEALTPDSSRFWPRQGWRPGANPPSLDKQFLRDWLETTGWNKEGTPPRLPREVIQGTTERYAEILAILTRTPSPSA